MILDLRFFFLLFWGGMELGLGLGMGCGEVGVWIFDEYVTLISLEKISLFEILFCLWVGVEMGFLMNLSPSFLLEKIS